MDCASLTRPIPPFERPRSSSCWTRATTGRPSGARRGSGTTSSAAACIAGRRSAGRSPNGAVAEAAADDAGQARTSNQVVALAPGVDPLRVFVALVPPAISVDADVDPGTCLRDVLSACLRTARASDSTTRRSARLAAELLADAVASGDDGDSKDSVVGDVTVAVRDALRAVPNPAAATPASVAARILVVAATLSSTSVLTAETVAGPFGHANEAVRKRAVELLAAGRVDDAGEAVDVVVEQFVGRLTGDSEVVSETALDAAPAVVGSLPERAADCVVDGLLKLAASDRRARRHRGRGPR